MMASIAQALYGRLRWRYPMDAMISPTDNPIQLPAACFQASCWFDRDSYSDDQYRRLGIVLPEHLSGAVPKRRAEFLAGRYCVRLALKGLGKNVDFTLKIGDKRAPIWPTGLIGSITHSKGFASAAVARLDTVRGIGIDSERLIAEKTANNVQSHILTKAEQYQDNQTLVSSAREYLTLIFSAKESIYKCLYPLVSQYFDFRDARIILEANQPGRFRFQLRKDLTPEFGHGFEGHGQYAIAEDFVHTAVVLV